MNFDYDKWQKLKNNYLKQVEQALASIDHPKSTDVLHDVDEHLERKYAELPPDRQNWEGCQELLIEMGPPNDYAELLSEDKPLQTARQFGINEFLAILFVVVLAAVGSYLVYNAKTNPSHQTTSKKKEFEPDKRVLGKWVTIDFVRQIEYFHPGETQWTGDLYLKTLTFYEDGTTSGPWTWTKGSLWHSGDQTHAKYIIQQIHETPYLFMEWISGDVTIRGQKPAYYVLKKAE